MATPDLDAFWMPFTPNRQFKASRRMVVSAEGIAYRTTDGREVLDGTAGLWCVGAGHRHPRIAAVIVEPVAGSTGVLVPPLGYLQRRCEICDRHGLLTRAPGDTLVLAPPFVCTPDNIRDMVDRLAAAIEATSRTAELNA